MVFGFNSFVLVNLNEENLMMDLMLGQLFYNYMVMVDLSDLVCNMVYFGGQLVVVKMVDGGVYWWLIINWLVQFGLFYVYVDYYIGVIFFVGGCKCVMLGLDGGLFVSQDEGVSFIDQKNIGLIDYLIYLMVIFGVDFKSVLIGLQDNGMCICVGNMSVFNQSFGGDGFGVGWLQVGGNMVLGSYVYGYIYYVDKMLNIQKKWNNFVFDDLSCMYNGIFVCDVYFVMLIEMFLVKVDLGGKVYFINMVSKIYCIDNVGVFWQLIFSGMDYQVYVCGVLYSVLVSLVDFNYFVVVGLGGFILMISNGGVSWVYCNNKVLGYVGFNSNIVYVNNNVFYVVFENLVGQVVYVVKFIDGGLIWQVVVNGLLQVLISCLLVVFNDLMGNIIYVVIFIGVYCIIDGGQIWQQFGVGLLIVQVSDLYMLVDGSFLCVFIYGCGVWDLFLC